MRRVLVLGIAVALLLAACGSSKSSTSGNKTPVQLSGKVTNKGTKTASGTSFTIEANDYFFNPTFVNAKPGTKLTVTIANRGQNTHTFTIVSASIDKTIAPGQSASVDITMPSSGSLNFYCRFHRSLGMQGAFVAK
jgi:plastocyanin